LADRRSPQFGLKEAGGEGGATRHEEEELRTNALQLSHAPLLLLVLALAFSRKPGSPGLA
jgi:hypothetical protein